VQHYTSSGMIPHMADNNFPNERVWLINTIADILVDLIQDEEDTEIDLDDMTDQMQNVAELVLEGLNATIESSDGSMCTIRVGVKQ
jgi:hypothetical protein